MAEVEGDDYNVVRAGITYDDKKRAIFPFGLRWIEVGGVRLRAVVKSVTAQHVTSEFGEVTIVLAGARFEEVDATEDKPVGPEVTDG